MGLGIVIYAYHDDNTAPYPLNQSVKFADLVTLPIDICAKEVDKSTAIYRLQFSDDVKKTAC